MVATSSKAEERKSIKMWWVPDKKEMLNCPQGLQYLINLDQLLIDQQSNVEDGF